MAASRTISKAPYHIGIVGLGLIGGSFARALKEGGHIVHGTDSDEKTLSRALATAVDFPLDERSLKKLDLIILATYPDAVCQWLIDHVAELSPHAMVIDISGIKRPILKTAEELSNSHDFCFIGCHPMAGTQFQGFDKSRATMFRGSPMVVVFRDNERNNKAVLLERLKLLLAPCGFGSFAVTTAEEHDRIIAYTSQLAHVVSNAYVKSPSALEHRGFSAGSYLDLTRVALLNAPMWTELFADNRDFLLDELNILIKNLEAYRAALDTGDTAELRRLLDEGDYAKRRAERQRTKKGLPLGEPPGELPGEPLSELLGEPLTNEPPT